jgi:roadblock/LC7 domain-containing protein
MARILSCEWTRRNWWQIGVLTIAGWTGFYIAMIAPIQYERQVAMQRSSGLGAVAGEPGWGAILARHSSRGNLVQPRRRHYQEMGISMASVVGGVPGGIPDGALGGVAEDAAARKIVRTTSLELEVKHPAESAEKIRALAEQRGGYMVSSEVSGNQDLPGGAITIRVPANRFEEARNEIKKLALRVENEKADANDVTKDYGDKEARLRNLRAEEAQYLAIMKRATSVKDTLEVSGKLSEVRGKIEQQQAEFESLAKQVDTAAITAVLRAEADTRVFGIHWHPLYEFKLAARDGLESLANYATTMTAAIFRLPAVLLWLATIILVAAIGWRTMRWVGRTLFVANLKHE